VGKYFISFIQETIFETKRVEELLQSTLKER